MKWFLVLTILAGCSVPFRPAPAPSSDVEDAGSVDLDAGDTDDTALAYPSCGEYFVLEPDGAVTRIAWGPCHT